MNRYLIRGGLATAAAAALLSIPLTSGDFPDRQAEASTEQPRLGDLRAEIFLPHYARIAGIHEALQARDTLSNAWLGSNMGIVFTRLDLLGLDADEQRVDLHMAEGREIAGAGSFSEGHLSLYVASVIVADNKVIDIWAQAVHDFAQMGLTPDHSNYVALQAMALDMEAFEDTYRLGVEPFGPLSEAIMTSHQEAVEAMGLIREWVDAVPSGMALLDPDRRHARSGDVTHAASGMEL